jgi:hypothetical protein
MRRHSKRLTLSPEFHDSLAKDADQLAEKRARVEDLTPPTNNPFEIEGKSTQPAPQMPEKHK